MKRSGPLRRAARFRPKPKLEFWQAAREQVIERDAGVCRVWGGKGKRPQVAHLHGLGKGRSRYRPATCSVCERDLNHPDNLVTTCSIACNDLAANLWRKEKGCAKPPTTTS